MPKLPRQLLAVYGAHGLNGLIGAAAVPLTVSLVGFSGYGLFSIYTLLVSYILLADLGVGKNLVRLLAGSPGPGARERQIRAGLAIYIALAATWFAAWPVLAFVIPRFVFPVTPENVAPLRWMVLLSMAEFTLGIPASLMQTDCVARQRFDAYARFSLLTGFTRNGAILLGAIVFGSPVAIAALLAARKIIDALIAGRCLGWLPRRAWIPMFDRGGFRAMLKQSAVLSVSQVVQSTVTSLGSLLVNAAFGLHGLGIFRSAFDLAGKIAFVSNGITLVVFPRAARSFAADARAGADARLWALGIRCSSILYACFAASALLLAPWVLPSIGLPDKSTIGLFMLLVIALSTNAHALLGNELLQAAGRYRSSIYFNASALVALALLFLAAKPLSGMLAIGWAWIGAALVSACVADGLVLELLRAPARQQVAAALGKALATAACAGLAATSFGWLPGAAAIPCIAVLLALLAPAVRALLPVLRGRTSVETVDEPAVCA